MHKRKTSRSLPILRGRREKNLFQRLILEVLLFKDPRPSETYSIKHIDLQFHTLRRSVYKFSTASDAVEPTKRPRALSNKKVLTESGGATTSFFFFYWNVGWGGFIELMTDI